MPQKKYNRLIASLRPEDFSILSHHFRETQLVQGQFLVERGERVDAVHFPQSGMISLVVEMPEDRTVEVAMIGSEGAVGLAAGLGSRISSITALVQVNGTSLCISASRFRNAVAQSQHLRDLIVRHTELQLGQIEQTAACNALHDVSERLSRWLLQTSDKIGDDTIPFTREFLGKMLGVQRGTIALTAAKFEAAGLIQTHRGRIELLNKKALRKHACACYDYIQQHIDRLVPKVSPES